MARVIEFHPRMMYQGHYNSNFENLSEIYDVEGIDRLDVELRVYQVSSGAPVATGQIWTTSDATFRDSSWWQVGSPFTSAATGVTTGAFSGLGRFVMAKLIVPAQIQLTAYLRGVAREA